MTPTALSNVRNKWVPELRAHNPHTPIVLVGTKVDLRGDVESLQLLLEHSTRPTTSEEGNALAAEIGAAGYFETNAFTQVGLKDLFDHVARTALKARSPPEKPSEQSSWGPTRCLKRLEAV